MKDSQWFRYQRKNLWFCVLLVTAYFSFRVVLAEGVYTMHEPYRYPLRPGMEAWKNLQTGGDMLIACDIPTAIVKAMSTSAIVDTCLDYPLQNFVITSSESTSHGLAKVLKNFSGLRELLGRSDAARLLVDRYEKFTREARRTRTPIPAISHQYIIAIFLRDEILRQMTNPERCTVAKLSLINSYIIRSAYGPSASEGPSSRLASFLLLHHGGKIDVNGRLFDGNSINEKEFRDFARRDIDFIPEKPFLDKLIDVGEQIDKSQPLQ